MVIGGQGIILRESTSRFLNSLSKLSNIILKTIYLSYLIIIRLIPQGTVDNNLGPDRLAGPKALDPNYCRQPTLTLNNLCLEVLSVHGTEYFLGPRHSPYSY